MVKIIRECEKNSIRSRFNQMNNNGDTYMPRVVNKRIKPIIGASTMELFKEFYTDSQFDLIKDIFCTYTNRGGVLHFWKFAMIPINRDPGDMTNEHGEWTKFIRKKLAYEWNSMCQ